MGHRYTQKSQKWRDRKNWADINFIEYVCPINETFHTVKKVGCDNETVVSTAAGRVTFKPGSFVSVGSNAGGRTEIILGFPPPGRLGSANYPIQNKVSVLDALGVAAANPDSLPENSTTAGVIITGFGFRDGDTWEAVKFFEGEWIPDPLITLTLIVVNSGSEVSMTIGVGATGVDYFISLRVSR